MMDCIRCGQCCSRSIIDEIFEIDLVREPKLKLFVEEIKDEPGQYFLKTPCPFLTSEKLCCIYSTRPNICVAYEPGSSLICSQFDKADAAMELLQVSASIERGKIINHTLHQSGTGDKS